MFKRTVVFHLKETDDAVLQKLKTLPFILSAERSGNKLVLDLDNPEDNNPEILELLVKAGYKVQFVGEVRHSLEEVYLKLVTN